MRDHRSPSEISPHSANFPQLCNNGYRHKASKVEARTRSQRCQKAISYAQEEWLAEWGGVGERIISQHFPVNGRQPHCFRIQLPPLFSHGCAARPSPEGHRSPTITSRQQIKHRQYKYQKIVKWSLEICMGRKICSGNSNRKNIINPLLHITKSLFVSSDD